MNVYVWSLLAGLLVATLTDDEAMARGERDQMFADDTEVKQTWVGHQYVEGRRKVPVLGSLKTHVETFFVAEVTKRGDKIEISQKPCAVQFDKVAGVSVSFDATYLPPERMTLEWDEGEGQYITRAKNAWQAEDVDRDGKPGLTVSVDAGICRGDLMVSSLQKSALKAYPTTMGGLAGAVVVDLTQSVLDAEGRCLGLLARDTHEVSLGKVAYIPAAAGTTCEDLQTSNWPLRITPESKRRRRRR